MCTITLTLAKRGEAIPGPYSSLTCFAGVRPGAVPERGEIEGHRHRRARWTFHSGQRRRHAHELRPCRRLSGEARDRLWRSGSRPSISFNSRSFTLMAPAPAVDKWGTNGFIAKLPPAGVLTGIKILPYERGQRTREG